jgi:hypothetical protein
MNFCLNCKFSDHNHVLFSKTTTVSVEIYQTTNKLTIN